MEGRDGGKGGEIRRSLCVCGWVEEEEEENGSQGEEMAEGPKVGPDNCDHISR